MEIGDACVLAHGEDVVEAVLEQVAEGGLVKVVAVEVRLAGEGVARQPSVRVVEHGSRRRQELDAPAGIVVLIVGEQRQRGVLPGPGQRRCDEIAVVVDEVDLRVAIARQAGDAVQQVAFLRDRPAQVELAFEAIEGARAGLDFVERLRGRTLADIVDETARWILPIEDGRRSAHDLEPLRAVQVQRQKGGERRALERTVDRNRLHPFEAADVDAVAALIHAEQLAGHTGRITHASARLPAACASSRSALITEIDCGFSMIGVSVLLPVVLSLAT